MRDDLISRSAVYNKLLELEELARNRVLDTPTNSPCYQRYVAQLNERTALKHLIADEPTAYDVDKVVEQIEEKSFIPGDRRGVSEIKVVFKDTAIEIIKAGGASDNY